MKLGPVLLLGGAAALLLLPSRRRNSVVESPTEPVCPVLTGGAGHIAGYDYLETTTGGASLDERLPIIFLLHGRGGHPSKIVNRLSKIKTKARVVLPRANGGTPDVPLWYDLKAATKDQGLLAQQMKSEARRLAVFVTEANRCLLGEGQPIAVGHSQGGGMALALSSEAPMSVGSVVVASAWLPEQLWHDHMPHAIMIHGSEDKIVDYERSRRQAESVDDVTPVDFETVAGHGHGLNGALLTAWQGAVDEAARVIM